MSAAARAEAGERRWLRPAALAMLWLPFLWRLAPAWSASVEQAHGWAVPLLAAYLAAERARWAPAARPMAGARRGVGWIVLAIALLALTPLLTVLEGNPGWPLAQWLAFGAVASATLAIVAVEDGAARARHFVFPVLFAGTALAWPTMLALPLVTMLVAMNAHLAAGVVSALGHPAVVSGSVIEVASGFVGIDEACSGMRSLQAVWMAGWFFGELFLLGWGRRVFLAAGAVAAAVVGNLIRTTTLTWLAAAHSPVTSERWHDRVGAVELAGTLIAVGLLAWAAGSRKARRPARSKNRGRVAGGLACWMAIAAGTGAAILPAEWYRAHEVRGSGAKVQWELVDPTPEWTPLAVPDATQRLLRTSTAAALSRLERATGRREFALVVSWDDDVGAALNAEAHDPAICLPAAGIAAPVARAPLELAIAGVPVTWSVASFVADGNGRQVFFCHWDAWLGRARETRPGALANVPAWRLARVREGRRHGDAAYMAFVVPTDDDAAGRAWMREWAPRLLRRR